MLPDKYILKTDTCWLWTSSRDKNGYGLFRVEGRTQRVPRLAWRGYYGNIPEGLHVLHSCDNPACVRKEHLFLGTHKKNMSDMAEKGRASRLPGPSNGRAILSREQVAEIRRSYTAKEYSQWELAFKYKISRGAIQHIVTGTSWA